MLQSMRIRLSDWTELNRKDVSYFRGSGLLDSDSFCRWRKLWVLIYDMRSGCYRAWRPLYHASMQAGA